MNTGQRPLVDDNATDRSYTLPSGATPPDFPEPGPGNRTYHSPRPQARYPDIRSDVVAGRRAAPSVRGSGESQRDNGRQIVAEQLYATLKTNHGDIEVRLLPNHAPKTVRNFVELAQGEREWTNPATG